LPQLLSQFLQRLISSDQTAHNKLACIKPVAGHTRWKAAKKIGLDRVPIIVIEMTDKQRRAFSVADNKTAEIADWDFGKLRKVLNELITEDVDIRDLGFSSEEMRRLLFNESSDENMIPDMKNQDILTKPGDLYILGSHRLLCGDSRDQASVKLITEGRTIDHVFGGLPYYNQREYSHWDKFES
jgi:hypothetical protein